MVVHCIRRVGSLEMPTRVMFKTLKVDKQFYEPHRVVKAYMAGLDG